MDRLDPTWRENVLLGPVKNKSVKNVPNQKFYANDALEVKINYEC